MIISGMEFEFTEEGAAIEKMYGLLPDNWDFDGDLKKGYIETGLDKDGERYMIYEDDDQFLAVRVSDLEAFEDAEQVEGLKNIEDVRGFAKRIQAEEIVEQ